MTWPERPVIHEVNTAVWLDDLSRRAGRRLTLADLSAADWAAVTPPGIDAVWLMGVWERSPAGLAIANDNPALRADFRDALPDLQTADVIGSPYCVRRYVVDAAFGGPDGLAAARAALADRGVRLVLDYVPNHVAPDHPWVTASPELFIQGDDHDVAADPAAWMTAAGHVLARGRDPYFPPWPDVVQLNAFSPALRAATANVLADIAAQCDGIRCDMAMLMINRVFAATWGRRAGAGAGPRVLAGRDRRPPRGACRHGADRGGVLGSGVGAAAAGLRLLLRQAALRPNRDPGHPRCPRTPARRPGLPVEAAAVSGEPRRAPHRLSPRRRSRDGRRRGDRHLARWNLVARRTVRGPTRPTAGLLVATAGRAAEPTARRLVSTTADDGRRRDVKRGRWQLLETTGWPDNQSCDNVLAWSWSGGDAGHLVVVNFSAQPAQARIHLDWTATLPPEASGSPTCSRAASISAMAPRSPTSACTSTCSRGSHTCSPWTASPPTRDIGQPLNVRKSVPPTRRGSRLETRAGGRMNPQPAPRHTSASLRRVLVPLALAQFICSFAGSNMNVMITDISDDLDTTVQGVQLAITIFLLVMAALMIPGGKLTDRYGRKRCFTIGLLIYGVGALISAVSPGLGWLILGNSIFEGIGTALLIPPVYILTTLLFTDLSSEPVRSG